jgi:hypothetical protein
MAMRERLKSSLAADEAQKEQRVSAQLLGTKGCAFKRTV